MKFMHLADLHLGKSVNGYSMIEDQKHALNEIINLIKKENIKILLIAGDIYQNSVPAIDAIYLFENFLYQLKDLEVTCLIISGNHDSADRLAYANKFLTSSNIYISNSYEGYLEKVTLEDKFGPVNFYLLPYIKPIDVKRYYPEKEIFTYTKAVEAAISDAEINKEERNVIISHQFIMNAELSDSEEIYAGDVEAVPANLYKDFDYVALGHIHKKQEFLNSKIRYPGALLKYSASEANYKKSITLVEIDKDGKVSIEEKYINYLRDMRIIEGYFDEIMQNASKDSHKDDYIHLLLEDEEDILDGLQRLRSVYPNIMTFRYKNMKIGDNNLEEVLEKSSNTSPYQLFEDFYLQRIGQNLDDSKSKIIKETIEEIWGKNEGK